MTTPAKPLTADEIADLLAKAKAATPGEWEAVTRDDPRGQPVPYYQSLICTVEHSPDRYLSVVAKNGHPISREEWEANNDYIAAANPETIIRLIAMIERQDEQIEKLREALSGTVEAITRYTQEHCGISGYTGARLVEAAKPSPRRSRSMTNDEAEKLAREIMSHQCGMIKYYDNVERICQLIISGDMKREIENAAFERAKLAWETVRA